MVAAEASASNVVRRLTAVLARARPVIVSTPPQIRQTDSHCIAPRRSPMRASPNEATSSGAQPRISG